MWCVFFGNRVGRGPDEAKQNPGELAVRALEPGSCCTLSKLRLLTLRNWVHKCQSYIATTARDIERSEFTFPQNVTDIVALAFDKTFAAYPTLIRDVFKYLSNLNDRGPKPNREAQLIGRFAKVHAPAQSAIEKAGIREKKARISCLFPAGGILDNTVNRLLLMSSSETHLPSVPMAFFIEELRREGN